MVHQTPSAARSSKPCFTIFCYPPMHCIRLNPDNLSWFWCGNQWTTVFSQSDSVNLKTNQCHKIHCPWIRPFSIHGWEEHINASYKRSLLQPATNVKQWHKPLKREGPHKAVLGLNTLTSACSWFMNNVQEHWHKFQISWLWCPSNERLNWYYGNGPYWHSATVVWPITGSGGSQTVYLQL